MYIIAVKICVFKFLNTVELALNGTYSERQPAFYGIILQKSIRFHVYFTAQPPYTVYGINNWDFTACF